MQAALADGRYRACGLARYRHWPDQRYDDMLRYLLPLMLVAATLLIAGVAVQVRSRRPTR